jgi:hypothetical protein
MEGLAEQLAQREVGDSEGSEGREAQAVGRHLELTELMERREVRVRMGQLVLPVRLDSREPHP